MTPGPPPPYSICILIHTGKGLGGGGGDLTRENVRGANASQKPVENTNMTDCISSLNTIKHQ
jgi:hypothetical protein